MRRSLHASAIYLPMYFSNYLVAVIMIDLAISAPANTVTSDLARRVCLMWKYVARRVDSNSSLRSQRRQLHQNLLGPEQVPRMGCRRLPSMSTWGVSLFPWKLNSPFNQSFYLGQMHGKPATTLVLTHTNLMQPAPTLMDEPETIILTLVGPPYHR